MLLAEIDALGGIATGLETKRRVNAIRDGIVPASEYHPADDKFRPANVPPPVCLPFTFFAFFVTIVSACHN